MWVESAMRDVAAAKLFPAHTHIFLMNKTELRRRMLAVTAAFNSAVPNGAVSFHHSFAIKANPLQAVVAIAKECGFAAETASIGEFAIAERVYGTQPNGIIFDSPTKTLEELHHALQVPCYLNVDNFEELHRVVALVRGEVAGFGPIQNRATVGIRINPQTVTHTDIAELTTGGKVSKFGISLHDAGNLDKIVESFVKYHDLINLRMIHVHSGSQGLSLDTMVAGVRSIVEEVANHPKIAQWVEVIDIGGGFPVDFSTDAESVSVKHYVDALQRSVPTLFAPLAAVKRVILTEFGRAIAAKSGVLISRVEYVKQSGGRQIISQHVGADLAVRTVWQPEKWPLRVFVYGEDGIKKTGSTTETDVAGPCCNSGCTLTRAALLPAEVHPLHDVVVVHDVGGYYHSTFSLYNIRQMPACFMYTEAADGNASSLVCIKKAQTVADTIQLFLTDV